MKEIVIISGKGGTGKTTLTGALAALVQNKVLADCDVDAADLHLILNPTVKQETKFSGRKLPSINPDVCTQCGKCREVCQFDAISPEFHVNFIHCEACGVCVWFCPVAAIDFRQHFGGDWFISETRFGPMVHARLGIAEENSGKLVALVRKEAKQIVQAGGFDYLLVDGAPGVGCPVISSISGASAVLIVTEPTLSGLHDLTRVASLSVNHFGLLTLVCVNKYDLNPEITREIAKYSEENGLKFIGQIPFDADVTQAMVAGKTILEFAPDGLVSQAIKTLWDRLVNEMEKG
jgi:MinD superfamily P-loop ATPase